jgi:general secretion pathway protein M
MTAPFNAWWRSRSLREQRLLLAASALLAIVLLWILIVRPLGDSLSRARERHGEAALALAEVRAQAALIRQLEGQSAPALGMPLEALIAQAAGEAGFPVTRVVPEGPGLATFASNSVRPQAFFAWLDKLEKTRGLAVERLATTANSDQTLTVEVSFRSRSR